MTKLAGSEASIVLVLPIVYDAWEKLPQSPFIQQQVGVMSNRLPDLSLTLAELADSRRTLAP